MASQTSQQRTSEVPGRLYHTLLTVTHFYEDTSGYAQATYPLGTHTSLPAAEAFAAHALETLDYRPDDFAEYAVRGDQATTTPPPGRVDWPYGDGTIVYAKQPARGREFLVRIDTTPNTEALPAGGPGDTPRLRSSSSPAPSDPHRLNYVIRTRVDYEQDRSADMQTTEVRGVYVRRRDALAAARKMLGERAEFAQYDEHADDEKGQWPFGDDVVAHAVAQTGQTYTVAVRTVPETHGKLAKHAKKG